MFSVVAGRGDFYDATNGYTSKEYYFDKNGNIWLDRNKRMKTVYNYLNLPSRISDTITPANKIEYVYTSAGENLKQRLSTGTTLLYFGNYVYTLDGTANGIAVKYILTQEGRATYSTGAYTNKYFMKDHLGNTRLSFNVPSTTAVIVQQSDYYPFGMIHQPQATAMSDNRLLYNGKELQNNLLGGVNLDIYDYGARFYDPQIGRWTTVDPLAETSRRWSPYSYCYNNPIIFIDPDGMWPDVMPGDPEKDRKSDFDIFNRGEKLEPSDWWTEYMKSKENRDPSEGWYANNGGKEKVKAESDNPFPNFYEKLSNLLNGNGFVSDEQLLSDIQSAIVPYIEKYTESLLNNGSPLTFEEFKKGVDLLIQYHVLNAVINLDDAVTGIAKDIIENPYTITGLVLISIGTGQFELLAVPTLISTYNTGQSALNYYYGNENLQTVLLQTGGTVIGFFGPQGSMAGELLNHASTITSRRNKK